MKSSKKNNKKGKFITLDNYEMMKKNDTGNCKTQAEDSYKNIKTFQEYETPLQTLQKLFPNFSEDVIETIYEENNRTFAKAKLFLEEMCREEEDFDYEDNSKTEKDSNVNNNVEQYTQKASDFTDINSFTRFKYEGDCPFIEDPEPASNNAATNLADFQKKKYYIDVNTIISQQKKNADEYVSVFSTLANDNTPKRSNTAAFEENYLEELTIDYYCDVILEFFPKFSRVEIMQKICDHDFDIDKLVLGMLDEKNEDMLAEEFSKLETSEISYEFKEEVLSNFYSGEVVENVNQNISQIEKVLFDHNLQNKIEKEIKKKNVTSKLNVLYNEKDFPFLSDEAKTDLIKSNALSDEYFLEKDIKDIKTKNIREDLQRLVKNFPFRDEFEIKWVFYQYMDYSETFKYFKKNSKRIGIFNEDNKDKDKMNTTINTGNYNVNLNETKLKEKLPNNNSVEGLLCKIISEKPSQWKIDANLSKINISDYQNIRSKLIWQAQLAWRSGRHQEAKVIMAKARRYKQEINSLLLNKKIEIFVKNNETNSIVNFMNNKENFIDLHGLSYEESKIILNKKISDIKRSRSEGLIDTSKRFVLNIITGVGNHSKDQKAVLLPRLTTLLKTMNYHNKVDWDRGIIRVYL